MNEPIWLDRAKDAYRAAYQEGRIDTLQMVEALYDEQLRRHPKGELVWMAYVIQKIKEMKYGA